MTLRLKFNSILPLIILSLFMPGLLACNASPPAATPDLVATEVAVQQAALATLTAAAPAPTTAAQATPEVPPRDTPGPATPTGVETQQDSGNTPEPQIPTPTRPLFAVVPVDGADDNDYLQGRKIILPGYPPEQVTIPPVFRDRLVFRVEAFDIRFGNSDGAGIQAVDITIKDENDEQVHHRREQTAGYCAFGGGEPDCDIWVFATHDYEWPEGRPIVNGAYRVEFDITSEEDNRTDQWRWSFIIADPKALSFEPGMIEAEIVQTGPGQISTEVTDNLVFQVRAFHTGYGNGDGDGISHVDMAILDDQGNVIHERRELNAAYCAFSGGEPDCNIQSLDQVEPGNYLLRAVIQAQDGQSRTIEMEIEIQ